MVENKYWSITKFHLNTLLYTLCWQWQRSNVFCKSSQGFSHTVAGILAHSSMQISRAVMFWGCRWATRTFNSLQRFFYGVQIWRLARPLQDLEMLLTKPLLPCPGGCVWDHCHAERPSHVSSSMPLLMEGGFHSKSHDTWPHSFLSFTQISRPGPFAEKQPQSMMFPPPCFTVGIVFFGWQLSLSFSSKHDKLSFYQKVIFWFNLTIWHSPNPLLDHPNAL